MSDNVTHVISPFANTNTVQRALATDGRVHAVRVEWLTDTAAKWCRQHEEGYLLGGEGEGGGGGGGDGDGGGGGAGSGGGGSGGSGSGGGGAASGAAGSSDGGEALTFQPAGLHAIVEEAFALVPSTLDTTARLSKMIIFLVPAASKGRAAALLEKFEQVTAADDEAAAAAAAAASSGASAPPASDATTEQRAKEKSRILVQLTELVVREAMRAVLGKFGLM